MKSLHFTHEDAMKANAEWGFNCGPAALCAVLGMTPEEIRPHLGKFKGWTNPTMMQQWLVQLHPNHRLIYKNPEPPEDDSPYPRIGVVRIQWGGSWCWPEVPAKARYPHTHWIGVRHRDGNLGPKYRDVFDINNLEEGGWSSFSTWVECVVPWILSDMPRANGFWWPTHCFQIESKIHEDWTRRMAEKEGNSIVSVGGLVSKMADDHEA